MPKLRRSRRLRGGWPFDNTPKDPQQPGESKSWLPDFSSFFSKKEEPPPVVSGQTGQAAYGGYRIRSRRGGRFVPRGPRGPLPDPSEAQAVLYRRSRRRRR